MQLGQVHMTRSIADLISSSNEFGVFVWESLGRHQEEDWGECDPEDIKSNNMALSSQGRILSVYPIPVCLNQQEKKIWIITEWDKSLTTVLLPRDY